LLTNHDLPLFAYSLCNHFRMYFAGLEACDESGCIHYHLDSADNDNFFVLWPKASAKPKALADWLERHCKIVWFLVDKETGRLVDKEDASSEWQENYELTVKKMISHFVRVNCCAFFLLFFCFVIW